MTAIALVLVMAGAVAISIIAISEPAIPIQRLAYGQSTDWNAEIDKCMISLKAENPGPAHLLECDEFMPMVPQMVAVDVIYNTSDVTQKVDEYLTQRSLEAYTEEEMEQKAREAEMRAKK